MMQIENILTPEEAKELAIFCSKTVNKRSHDFEAHPIIKKVADTYKTHTKQPLKFSEPSYWVLETRTSGHDWHYDGCKEEDGKLIGNHMAWCRYGSSILISDPEDFTGGDLFYKDNEGNEILVENHYLKGCIYGAAPDNNPVLHKATTHKGKRKVLLMFFGA
tara:strand:- start:485 stop:970 length:486 start_codon:yes stop_codon:yes gene_type:complete